MGGADANALAALAEAPLAPDEGLPRVAGIGAGVVEGDFRWRTTTAAAAAAAHHGGVVDGGNDRREGEKEEPKRYLGLAEEGALLRAHAEGVLDDSFIAAHQEQLISAASHCEVCGVSADAKPTSDEQLVANDARRSICTGMRHRR